MWKKNKVSCNAYSINFLADSLINNIISLTMQPVEQRIYGILYKICKSKATHSSLRLIFKCRTTICVEVKHRV